MKIHLFRHGQASFNVTNRLQGQSDESILTEQGREQVRRAIEDIRSLGITMIISSPLSRAHESAKIIAQELNLPIYVRAELMEKDTGDLTGMTWEKASEIVGYDLKKRIEEAGDLNFSDFNGESPEDAKRRLMPLFAEIKRNHPHEKVLFVTHGGILNLMHVLFSERNEARIANASIHEFDIGDIEAVLLELNQS